jgi:fluoride exporter
MNVLAIAVGGCLGALLRNLIGLLVHPVAGFPLGTLLINWIGCLFLGWFFTITSTRWNIPSFIRAGIGTGLTGAFTTFSAFSVETVRLLEEQRIGAASLYIILSTGGGVLLAWLGLRMASKTNSSNHA